MTENTPQLSPARRRALRAAAHPLKPVVSISQKGLTPSVLAEIDRCLKAHELIKLRLYGMERDAREALFAEICSALACAEVQHIGNLLVLWREHPKDDAAIKSAPATRRKPEAMTKKQAAARNEARSGKR
ncbi:MAG: YhbY family RNA-binding protein [Sulfuritalea sp.]|jgi:RNA-binding protein|nr:YhbY family RNA-binding protein [Sulfuritalea sp.]